MVTQCVCGHTHRNTAAILAGASPTSGRNADLFTFQQRMYNII